jgi:hypothetical protein
MAIRLLTVTSGQCYVKDIRLAKWGESEWISPALITEIGGRTGLNGAVPGKAKRIPLLLRAMHCRPDLAILTLLAATGGSGANHNHSL